jgi:hypothetical protein
VSIGSDKQKGNIYFKELNWQVSDIYREVKIGQVFDATVISIDKYGIGLSLRKK